MRRQRAVSELTGYMLPPRVQISLGKGRGNVTLFGRLRPALKFHGSIPCGERLRCRRGLSAHFLDLLLLYRSLRYISAALLSLGEADAIGTAAVL